jgi:hypothetical protein
MSPRRFLILKDSEGAGKFRSVSERESAFRKVACGAANYDINQIADLLFGAFISGGGSIWAPHKGNHDHQRATQD